MHVAAWHTPYGPTVAVARSRHAEAKCVAPDLTVQKSETLVRHTTAILALGYRSSLPSFTIDTSGTSSAQGQQRPISNPRLHHHDRKRPRPISIRCCDNARPAPHRQPTPCASPLFTPLWWRSHVGPLARGCSRHGGSLADLSAGPAAGPQRVGRAAHDVTGRRALGQRVFGRGESGSADHPQASGTSSYPLFQDYMGAVVQDGAYQ